MSTLREWVIRLWNTFRPSRSDRDLEDELRSHAELLAEETRRLAPSSRERAIRTRGLRQALETLTDQRGLPWVADVAADMRYSIRHLRRSPAFTVVVVLTLALGIGATTALFSLLNGLMLRALPVHHPERLAVLSGGTPEPPGMTALPYYTYAVWAALRDHRSAFEGVGAWSAVRFDAAESGETVPVEGLYVSGEFFTTVGVAPMAGRLLTATDDVRGAEQSAAAVISYAFWQRRFGGAPHVIGETMMLDRVPFTIVGVTPPEFFGAEVGRSFDVAVPLAAEVLLRPQDRDTRLDIPAYYLRVLVRLHANQSLETATERLRSIQPQLRDAAMPKEYAGFAPMRQEFLRTALTLTPAAFGTSALRQRYTHSLVVILTTAGLVLLATCVNVANLLMGRAAAKRQELSIRAAIGASRRRLARQSLMESLVLAMAGGTVGILVAAWASRALVTQLSTVSSPVTLDASLDWRVAAFVSLIVIISTLLFGVGPALHATRVAPTGTRGGERIAEARVPAVTSGTLVVGQIAISLVLVVLAALFVGTFIRLRQVPLGFDPGPIVIVTVSGTRLPPEDRTRVYEEVTRSVAAVPGVRAAAGSQLTPLSDPIGFPLLRVDLGPSATPIFREVRTQFVTPGWLQTYGTPLRAGRDLTDHDNAEASLVALVNETFERLAFSPGRAVGQRVSQPTNDAPMPRVIVGVVADTVVQGLRDRPQPTMYVPLRQFRFPYGLAGISISVRAATGSPLGLVPSIAAAIARVDPQLTFSVRPLVDQIVAARSQERLVALLSSFFGGFVLVLAAVGVYGLLTNAVAQRTRELAIRMALGAQRRQVVALVLRRTAILTAVGIGLGLVGALMATRLVEGLLFDVKPRDPLTLFAASLLFAVVAGVAAFVPARRATHTDPLVALRSD